MFRQALTFRFQKVLNYYLSAFEKEENIDLFHNLLNVYLNSRELIMRFSIASHILRSYFELLNKFERNSLGLEFFSSISNMYEINVFSNNNFVNYDHFLAGFKTFESQLIPSSRPLPVRAELD